MPARRWLWPQYVLQAGLNGCEVPLTVRCHNARVVAAKFCLCEVHFAATNIFCSCSFRIVAATADNRRGMHASLAFEYFCFRSLPPLPLPPFPSSYRLVSIALFRAGVQYSLTSFQYIRARACGCVCVFVCVYKSVSVYVCVCVHACVSE